MKERHRVEGDNNPQAIIASRWRVKRSHISFHCEAMKIFSSLLARADPESRGGCYRGRFHVPLLLLGRCDLVRA